ncbi:hypothetical protein BX600DRAFT_443596 [Xylariales sp. PMI_506]|nr:hypothetical protein BX600DRAFT_443596 [Xylariales sp. PMI_506]
MLPLAARPLLSSGGAASGFTVKNDQAQIITTERVKPLIPRCPTPRHPQRDRIIVILQNRKKYSAAANKTYAIPQVLLPALFPTPARHKSIPTRWVLPYIYPVVPVQASGPQKAQLEAK